MEKLTAKVAPWSIVFLLLLTMSICSCHHQVQEQDRKKVKPRIGPNTVFIIETTNVYETPYSTARVIRKLHNGERHSVDAISDHTSRNWLPELESNPKPTDGFRWYKLSGGDPGWVYGRDVGLNARSEFDSSIFGIEFETTHDVDRDGSLDWIGFVFRINQDKSSYAQMIVATETSNIVPSRYALSIEHWDARYYDLHSFRDVNGDGVDELIMIERSGIEGGTEEELSVYQIRGRSLVRVMSVPYFAAYSASTFQGLSLCSDFDGSRLTQFMSETSTQIRTIRGVSQKLEWIDNRWKGTDKVDVVVRAKTEDNIWRDFHGWKPATRKVGLMIDGQVSWVEDHSVRFESRCLQQGFFRHGVVDY